MKTVGIIAEYNPFHNGHLYQIQQAKEITGADSVVVVMSGDFVQRGEPAWTDKYLRTQMALTNGVDFVFELPVVYATSSAEIFALAGVSLLTSLGFVDSICFGSECGNLTLLTEVADFLTSPDATFEENMRKLISSGISYPAAKETLLKEHFSDELAKDSTLLSSPNNILAIEYLKAISLLKSSLTPYTITRKAAGYHNLDFQDSFASASAIRNLHNTSDHISGQIASVIPGSVLDLLTKETTRYPITADDFSVLLYYSLATISSENCILDLNVEILNRIHKNMSVYTHFSEFAAQIKPKQYTYSRISRALLHTMLHISNYQSLYQNFDGQKNTSQDNHPMTPYEFASFLANYRLPFVPYARLLGFVKEKSPLLRKNNAIPIITKPADGNTILDIFYSDITSQLDSSMPFVTTQQLQTTYLDYANYLYEKDIFVSNLYAKVQQNKLGGIHRNEYRQNPVIL